jgi:dipeptidyl aminopeptidase/acylaminoacyl peptidase
MMRPRLLLAALICAAIPASRATESMGELTLSRVTPVPANQPIPASDFGRPLLFEQPRLNPSGTRFAAYIENLHLATNILVCDISTGKVQWSDTGSNVVTAMWLNDDDLRIGTSAALRRRGLGMEVFGGVYSVRGAGDLDKVTQQGKWHGKFGAPDGTDQVLLADWPTPWQGPIDGFVYAYWARPETGLVDFCIYNDRGKTALYRYDGERFVKSPIDPLEIVPVDVGSKRGEMIAIGPRQEGKPRALQYVDVATGALGAVIHQDAQSDGYNAAFRKPGNWDLLGVSVPHSAEHAVWMDPKHQRVQEMLNHFFPKSYGLIVSADRNQNRFLIEEISDIKPPTYYMVDLEKHSMGLIKNAAPWIDPSRMRPVQIVSYKARDGAPIEGFLTLPAGASKEHPVALIVLPHGGPWSERTVWGWDSDAQFFASRGYAVFRPNYRGTPGYDWRFPKEDRWDFVKMDSDVTDGTKAMIKTGLFDPARIAIAGFGFGGYLAICGATADPCLYRCALTIGGVFDWKEAADMSAARDDTGYYMLRKHVNAEADPDEGYRAISPLGRADRIKIPIFITNNIVRQNTRDITTLDTQTFELAHSIPRGVPKVVYGNLHLTTMDDAFVDVVERAEAMEKFLATYLVSTPPAPAN